MRANTDFWATYLAGSDSSEACHLGICNFFLYPALVQVLLALNSEEVMPKYSQCDKSFIFPQSEFT